MFFFVYQSPQPLRLSALVEHALDVLPAGGKDVEGPGVEI